MTESWATRLSWAALKQNRRQVCPSGFIVKPRRHQRHRLNDSKSALEAPTEQCRVASWDKNPRPLKFRGSGNQRLQVLISLAHSMTEEGDGGSVGFDLPIGFGDHGCPLLNSIAKLTATVVAMDSHA